MSSMSTLISGSARPSRARSGSKPCHPSSSRFSRRGADIATSVYNDEIIIIEPRLAEPRSSHSGLTTAFCASGVALH